MKQLKVVVFIIFIATLFSCENYRYEAHELQIDAKILGVTNECIGIEYEVVNVLILEDLCDLKTSQLSYITSNAKDEIIKLNLKIIGTDVNYTDGMVYFKYFLGGEKIGENQRNVNMSYLKFGERLSKLSNFEWKIWDGDKVKNPEDIKKESSESKLVEVEEPESKPKDSNSLPTLKVN